MTKSNEFLNNFNDYYYGNYKGGLFLASNDFDSAIERKVYGADWSTPNKKVFEVTVRGADNDYTIEMDFSSSYARGFLVKQVGSNGKATYYDWHRYSDGSKTISITESAPIVSIASGFYARYLIVETAKTENSITTYTLKKLVF
jgi:hypothetical protein